MENIIDDISIKGINYKNGKIYTIRSPNTNKIYIGSTTQSLSRRLTKHKTDYTTNRLKTTSRILFELGEPYIELLECHSCNSKIELMKREGELIRQYKDICVNKCIAGRTQNEYQIENKDKIKEYKNSYYINNKDKLKKVNQKYYIDNKDKIKEYQKDNKDKIKEYQKQYNKDNKDIIKGNQKQYNKDNKDKIKEYQKQYNKDYKDKIKEI